MQIRNDRAPRGVDVGQASAASGPRYSGSYAVPKQAPAKAAPKPDAKVNSGRFQMKETDDPIVARRRAWWRKAQQRYRDKKKGIVND